jgi:hypothetical protein
MICCCNTTRLFEYRFSNETDNPFASGVPSSEVTWAGVRKVRK